MPEQNKFKANYSAFDFSKHLRAADDGGSMMQGLFFLKATEWQPADFGLEPVRADDIQASGAAESAATIRSVLAGTDGPARRITLANAAAGLYTVGTVATLAEGVAVATESVEIGRARRVLEQLLATKA